MANTNNLKNKYTSQILNMKKEWDKYNAAGDEAGKAYAQNTAANAYKWLEDNGYYTEAQTLRNQNYTQAAESAKNGKTQVRPFFYQLGIQYGVTPEQINNLLSYDDDTGQVSFGGKNLGALTEIGGTTYADSDYLKNTYAQVMNDLGIGKTGKSAYETKRDETMSQQSDAHQFIKDNLADYKKENAYVNDMARYDDPLNSDYGQSIMDLYQWNGKKAGNNAAATTAGSNSGNIDSYAAANAARQQKAYTDAGVAKVYEQFLNRLGIVQNNLYQLGTQMTNSEKNMMSNIQLGMDQAQQSFDNWQTELNNEQSRANMEMERLGMMSDITGYIPDELQKQNNIYFDNSGNLINPNIDYQDIINRQNAILESDTASDEQKRQAQEALRQALQARSYKVLQMGYDDYGTPVVPYAREENATMRTNAANNDLQELLGRYGLMATQDTNAVNERINNAQISSNERMQAGINASNEAIANTEAAARMYESEQSAKAASPYLYGDSSGIYGTEGQTSESETNSEKRLLSRVLSATNNSVLLPPQTKEDKARIISVVSEMHDVDDQTRIDFLKSMGITDEDLETVSYTPYR